MELRLFQDYIKHMKWTGPKSQTWRSDLSWPGADLTYWIKQQLLSPSQTPRDTFQVMRHKALRAPHDSAMVSCSLYLCSCSKKSPKQGLVSKKWSIPSNPAELLWRDWVGHAAARSRQRMWKLIKNRNTWWSNATESSLVIESNADEPVCVCVCAHTMYTKYALPKKK